MKQRKSEEKSLSPNLKEFGDELDACGKNWGESVDLSGNGVISQHTTVTAWIETAVTGVIGLQGNEVGNGPSVVIKNVEHSDIDMIWTNGLIGCMGLAITGRDEQGKLDVFFGHARKYDTPGAVNDKNNPMHLAKEFVSTHLDIRVYWGTGFYYGETGETRFIVAQMKKDKAQSILSRELGCWVRNYDCIVSSSLVFFPKLGIMKEGSPSEAYRSIETEYLSTQSTFSKSKELSLFQPDPTILKNLEDHLTEITIDRSSKLRFYLLDTRRDNKIQVLQRIIEAYKVGNIDVLRHFAAYAQNRKSPTRDESAKNIWNAVGESETASLVIRANEDAILKIQAMGSNGCGLYKSGADITYMDYKKLVSVEAAIVSTPGLSRGK